MGIRSYVAGLKADGIEQATNLGFNALGMGAKLYERKQALDLAKEKTDINREYKGAQSEIDKFLNDLQYDRDYQNYNQRVEEKFGELSSTIHDNPLISDGARRELLENHLPQLKQEALGKAAILGTNAQMAEIEVEIEGFGDTVASDPDKSLEDAVSEYRSHVEDLGIYNPVTVGKMVDEFSYSTAPLKALQQLQGDYQAHYLKEGYSLDARIDQVGSELGLDATQAKALKKSVYEFQGNFDKNIDAQFSEEKDILLGQIAGTRDEGKMFDIASIESMLPQVPARHRLELYKAKNTAMANNDDLLFNEVKKVLDEGAVFTDEDWELVDLFNDPKKRDEVAENLLVNQGNGLITSGGSLAEARSLIDGFDGPFSLRNRTEAKARLTKAYLEQESDVSKVAKDMLSSSGYSGDLSLSVVSLVQAHGNDAPPIDPEQAERRGKDYVSEHVQEVAKVIQETAGTDIGEADIQEAAEEIVSSQISSSDLPDEVKEGFVSGGSAWIPAYEEKMTSRRNEVIQERAEFQSRLDAEANRVQSIAGIEASGSQKNERPMLAKGMSQTELVTTALQVIKEGNGRYITASELSLVRDDALRQELTTLASIRDSLVIDSPIVLDYLDQLRRDPAISEDKLRLAVRDFVDHGLIKADTAETEGLTKKYSFAENGNQGMLQTMISNVVSAIYPSKSGAVIETKKTYLRGVLEKAADDAITMNPDLMGKDFPLLQKQLESYAVTKTAKAILADLGDVANLMAEGNVARRIDNLAKGDISTFLQDVQDGRYDLLINWDFVQRPEMRSSRHDTKDVLRDKVVKGLTPYRDFKDLEKNGTQFERLQVMANTSFILTGGTLEKSLTGSFGIKPSDMKVAGRQWAFADPEADGLYFIATDTDMQGRGTLGWGMANADYDGTKGFIMFRDYVDPKLAYDIENLHAQMNDPLFERKKIAADNNRNQSPLGTAGLGYSPIRIQESFDDRYYGVIESHEAKTKELDELTTDIMTYRHNLLGTRTGSLPNRL